MKRIMLVAVAALLFIAGPPAARAGSALPAINSAGHRNLQVMKHYIEVDDGVWVAVKGMRERRQVRFARLVESWSPDQQKVAHKHGWPESRYREDYAGRIVEIWTYPDADKEYVFQVPSGELVETRLR
jgi:hypothetical protein